MRFDSEHVQKAYVKNIQLIRSYPSGWKYLSEFVSELTGGATPLGADYPDSGVPFLRVQNIMPNFIDDSDMGFITAADDALLSRSRLKLNDVLLTITGVSYGKAAVATPEFVGSNINQHSVRIALKSGLRPHFLAAFLNASPGKLQSDQNITGVTRPALDYPTIRSFSVPLCSEGFQAAVEKAVVRGLEHFQQAKHHRSEADQTLLSALGLEDWQPPEPLTYTRTASDAFTAGRIDSDYFSPARYATIEVLAAKPHKLLSERCDSIRELFDPNKPGEITRVRNFDLGDALKPSLDDNQEIVSTEEVGSTKKHMQAGDLVVSRLRSYLRQIAVVRTSDKVPTVGSTEFIVLRPRDGIDPELLMVFLRSHPVQTILKYCQEGNQHPRFHEDNLLSIPVPDVLFEHSGEITKSIRAAHAARHEARELLERAKRAVEIAIEQDEKAAIQFLNQR